MSNKMALDPESGVCVVGGGVPRQVEKEDVVLTGKETQY